MKKSLVSQFAVGAEELPTAFAGQAVSGRMVQSNSMAAIALSPAAVAAYAAAVRDVDFAPALAGAGVEVAVTPGSAPHHVIAPYAEQVKLALEGVAALTRTGAFGLFADAGLGKTLILGMMAAHFMKTTQARKVLYVGVGNWFTARRLVEKRGRLVAQEVMGDGHKLIAAGGVPAEQIVEFKGKPVNLPTGVIFTTYGRLKSSPKRNEESGAVDYLASPNFKALVESLGGADFDGMVVLDEIDEAANTGNLTAQNGGEAGEVRTKNASASKAFLACQELQRYFTKAKFVYASATPTTSKYNSILAMSRLALWGEGQPVKSLVDFRSFLEEYQLLFLEEISRQLRYQGQINYLAHDRSAVQSLVAAVPLSPATVAVRDRVAQLWGKLFDYVETQAQKLPQDGSPEAGIYRMELRKDLALRMQAFGMLLNNSFRAPAIAENVVRMVRGEANAWGVTAADAAGLSPVLFMDKTYDSGIKREIQRAKQAQGVSTVAELDVAQMDFTVKSDFMALVENGRWRYEMDFIKPGSGRKGKMSYRTVNYPENARPMNLVWDEMSGDYRVVPHNFKGVMAATVLAAWPVYDFAAHPNHIPHMTNEGLDEENGVEEDFPLYNLRIKNPESEALCAELRALVEEIEFPLNAVDYIQNHVAQAGGKVFELSGRGGSWRSDGTKMVLIPKLATAMEGYLGTPRAVGIVTRAGARAISLHDRPGVENLSQRVGVFADFGWNANKTIQASGRILRLGQVHYPVYVLPRLEDYYEYRVTAGLIKAIAAQGAITAADSRGKDIELLAEDNDLLDDYGQRALNQYLLGLDEHEQENIDWEGCPNLRALMKKLRAGVYGAGHKMDLLSSVNRFVAQRDNRGIVAFFNRTMLLPYEESQRICAAIMAVRQQLLEDDENNEVLRGERLDLRTGGKIRAIEFVNKREHVVSEQWDTPALYKLRVDRLVYTLPYARVIQREVFKHGFWGEKRIPAVMVPSFSEKGEKSFDIYTPRGKSGNLAGYMASSVRLAEASADEVAAAWDAEAQARQSKYEQVTMYVLENGIRNFGGHLRDNMIRGLPRDVYFTAQGQAHKISGLLLAGVSGEDVERWATQAFTREVTLTGAAVPPATASAEVSAINVPLAASM